MRWLRASSISTDTRVVPFTKDVSFHRIDDDTSAPAPRVKDALGYTPAPAQSFKGTLGYTPAPAPHSKDTVGYTPAPAPSFKGSLGVPTQQGDLFSSESAAPKPVTAPEISHAGGKPARHTAAEVEHLGTQAPGEDTVPVQGARTAQRHVRFEDPPSADPVPGLPEGRTQLQRNTRFREPQQNASGQLRAAAAAPGSAARRRLWLLSTRPKYGANGRLSPSANQTHPASSQGESPSPLGTSTHSSPGKGRRSLSPGLILIGNRRPQTAPHAHGAKAGPHEAARARAGSPSMAGWGRRIAAKGLHKGGSSRVVVVAEAVDPQEGLQGRGGEGEWEESSEGECEGVSGEVVWAAKRGELGSLRGSQRELSIDEIFTHLKGISRQAGPAPNTGNTSDTVAALAVAVVVAGAGAAAGAVVAESGGSGSEEVPEGREGSDEEVREESEGDVESGEDEESEESDEESEEGSGGSGQGETEGSSENEASGEGTPSPSGSSSPSNSNSKSNSNSNSHSHSNSNSNSDIDSSEDPEGSEASADLEGSEGSEENATGSESGEETPTEVPVHGVFSFTVHDAAAEESAEEASGSASGSVSGSGSGSGSRSGSGDETGDSEGYATDTRSPRAEDRSSHSSSPSGSSASGSSPGGSSASGSSPGGSSVRSSSASASGTEAQTESVSGSVPETPRALSASSLERMRNSLPAYRLLVICPPPPPPLPQHVQDPQRVEAFSGEGASTESGNGSESHTAEGERELGANFAHSGEFSFLKGGGVVVADSEAEEAGPMTATFEVPRERSVASSAETKDVVGSDNEERGESGREAHSGAEDEARSPGSPFGKAMAQLHAVKVRKEAARAAEANALAAPPATQPAHAGGSEREQATGEWADAQARAQLGARDQSQWGAGGAPAAHQWRAHTGEAYAAVGGGEGEGEGEGGQLVSDLSVRRSKSLHSCATIKQLQAATALAKLSATCCKDCSLAVQSIAETLAELSVLALAEAQAETEAQPGGHIEREVGVRTLGGGGVGAPPVPEGSLLGSLASGEANSEQVSEGRLSSRGTPAGSDCTRGSCRRTWYECAPNEILRSASSKKAPKRGSRRLAAWTCRRPLAETESEEEGMCYVVPTFDVIR